ncbi:hypothetical protein FC85_GL001688 [Lentilactobacillus diolivorans DSM 14421]|uniref:N-acetyltransferase domain-containing protein n=2 Tax=Lentilactobacillus diolivorans TaxID=179838 RepID=A0A0R1S120_9LACO|nr:hypothetical protein FC85_GL001688 [Lentilactobacillus diolivorans DSM 14421]
MPQNELNQNSFESFFTKGLKIMTSFEKFHPVLTSHYTLDWLTQTPVKQVDNLYTNPNISTVAAEKLPTQILDTVKRINHIMQKVMNDKQLTWGVTDSNNQTFVGIITISGFDHPNQIGELDFIVDQAHSEALGEIVRRSIQFVADHFNFNQLQVNLSVPNDVVQKSLIENQFKTNDQKHFILDL